MNTNKTEARYQTKVVRDRKREALQFEKRKRRMAVEKAREQKLEEKYEGVSNVALSAELDRRLLIIERLYWVSFWVFSMLGCNLLVTPLVLTAHGFTRFSNSAFRIFALVAICVLIVELFIALEYEKVKDEGRAGIKRLPWAGEVCRELIRRGGWSMPGWWDCD